jgi:hypothetical protein
MTSNYDADDNDDEMLNKQLYDRIVSALFQIKNTESLKRILDVVGNELTRTRKGRNKPNP